MNPYCQSALHQIEIAINTVIKMIDKLSEEDLQKRPTPIKYSIGELVEHIAVICEADRRISIGATQEEMKAFYKEKSYEDLRSLREGIKENFQSLRNHVENLEEEELFTETASHWGVTYTRYEWLLETMAHLYHHRGQLQAMLVHCYGKDPKISMFE